MGTNTNQIATRANINSGKRKTAYYKAVSESDDSLKKCPTKGEINQIEFLDVKNASTERTEDNAYNYVSGLNWTNTMGVGPNNTTVNLINIAGTPYVVPNTKYSFILINTSPGYYAHNNTSSAFNVKFDNRRDMLDDMTLNGIKNKSLWSKTIQTTIGKRTQIKISLTASGYAATRSIKDYFENNLICSATPINTEDIRLSIYVYDNNNKLIDSSLAITESDLNNILFTFTATTSATTLYLVPELINVSFYPKVTGNLYVGVGFGSTITTTIYDSYYDNNSKLAQYEDIGTDSARKFGVYYGVWNNKSTPARVDFAEALIHTTPDTYATGWISVGKVTLSDIAGNGTRSGVITCTLPANINLATTQYYIIIKVGDTLSNQKFHGGWGNAKEDVTYEYCQKGTRGWTPPIPLTPTSYTYDMNGESYNFVGKNGVLNNMDLYNGSAELNAGVYNTNPEYKGWIVIT